MNKLRKVKVIKVKENELTFENDWFTCSDSIKNDRTGQVYLIDLQYAKGEKVEIIAYNEFRPYDIKVGDLFYIEKNPPY